MSLEPASPPTLPETKRLTRRAFIKRGLWLGAGALSVGTFGWATEVEPDRIEIVRRSLILPRLAPVFDGLTITQVSDIHLSSWMTSQRLHGIVQQVNGLNSDVIALTGDFVSRRQEEHIKVLAENLKELKARQGVFAVLGNHDHWSGPDLVRKAIKKSGVAELCNTLHSLERGGESLHLCGLDDAWANAADVAKLGKQIPQYGAAVLLAHEPDFADDYAKMGRFDLQLSGHSHGGQVRAPLIGPLLLPHFGQKYHTAHYNIGAAPHPMQLYVNRGVGMVWPYVRLNCRPEITVFTLRSAGAT